ncbi:30S ribosomal protein S19 [Candidatus Woesearchaeota archaeon]|nr:30S ribosomal protein S19 [Candidatus Woesearchaeota archaeon]
MAREYRYRGKTLEELKKMDFKEFIQLLPSRKFRSLKRGIPEDQKALMKKVDKAIAGTYKKNIKTQNRDVIVVPKMVGLMIHVHAGNRYAPVMIEPEMIGMYLGELVLTRNRVKHSAPGVGATRSSSAISVR